MSGGVWRRRTKRWTRKLIAFLHSRAGTWTLAVLAAVLLWWTVREATSNIQSLDAMPLTVHAPDGWMVVEQSVREVNLTFKGSKSEMAELRRDAVQVALNMQTNANTNTFAVLLGPEQVTGPRGAHLESISPARLRLRMEPVLTRQIPIRLVTQSILPDGYEIVHTTLTPSVISVTGPSSSVSRLASVPTEPLNLSGLVSPVHATTFRVQPPPENSHLSYGARTVQLDVGIAARRGEKFFPNLPVRLLVPPGQPLLAELTPETCNVTLHGRETVLASLKADDVRLFVEPSTFVASPNTVLRKVQAQLPAEIPHVMLDPPEVLVRILPSAPDGGGQ
ncbi:MAG: YbbR-like domain-containing protein [Kiritimatiellae bacterium]|nr:YbbR-like domain-containing protein [Kiritimatiellia bacterium]